MSYLVKCSNYIYNFLGSRGVSVYSISFGSNSFHDIISRDELLRIISANKHRKHSIGLFTKIDDVILFVSKRTYNGIDLQISINFSDV